MILGEISEENKEIINEVVEKTLIEQYMNIYYFSVSNQKQVFKVKKLGVLGESVSKKSSTVCFCINEDIFERLDPNQQKMLVEDAINQISYDDEKDKISIEAPAITMTVGGWRKYGAELANAYEMSLLTAQQLEEEKKEAKAAASEEKKTKRNK